MRLTPKNVSRGLCQRTYREACIGGRIVMRPYIIAGGYLFTVAFRYPSTPEAVDRPMASSVMRRKSFSRQR